MIFEFYKEQVILPFLKLEICHWLCVMYRVWTCMIFAFVHFWPLY